MVVCRSVCSLQEDVLLPVITLRWWWRWWRWRLDNTTTQHQGCLLLVLAGAGAAPTIIIIQYLGCLAGGLATCTTATSPGSCTVQYRGSALYRGHRRHLWPPPDCAPDTEYLHLEEAEWLLAGGCVVRWCDQCTADR